MIRATIALVFAILVCGCGPVGGPQPAPNADAVDAAVREKWGRGLAELPVKKLVLVSPHNENIQKEYAWAFSNHCAVEKGFRVEFEWRDVGGGSSTIRDYLLNVYSRADSSGVDIVWGGGEPNFRALADAGVLSPVTLPDATLSAIPAQFGGVALYDSDSRWFGSAVSGFGFLYNQPRLLQAGLPLPATWDDLARPEFHGVIALADPTQSGSIAAVYEMIVQGESSWPEGWAKLLLILANAKQFYDGAGDAANAPLVGDALVAACIDFYGALRVEQAPDALVYVSPQGQTAFTPDPIAKLRNPPNPELADAFIEFVLSRRGQALLALPVGHADGPLRNVLGRQPVRRDVYEAYAGQFLSWIVNPYQAGNEMVIDPELQQVRYNVLRQLVRAAAIDNRDGLRAAYSRLIESNLPQNAMNRFARLPDNVDTIEEVRTIAEALNDPKAAERIITEWQLFFRDKYETVRRTD